MAIIQSGATTDLLTVDPTTKAARVAQYDSGGNVLAPLNRGAVIETVGGLLNAGKDYKVAHTIRVASTGGIQVAGDDTILLTDAFEGTTRNLNQWIETTATMTSAQTVAVGLTLNSGASVTTAQGILESSHRQFPVLARSALVFRAHMNVTGVTNCFEEWGFSDQASATTALHNNGAFFRRDTGGSLQPVLAFNGVETQGSVMTQPATTDYATYEIFLESRWATFTITSHTGAVISSQVMEIGSSGGSAGVTTQARMFAVTHIPAMMRVYNNGTAGTAPKIIVNDCTVELLDVWSQRSHVVQQSGLGLNSLTSPTAYTQLANYANSAAPASATLSNTAAGYTTLGGQFQYIVVAAAETDYALFGWQNPSPYTFYCTGIRVSNQWVMSIATTGYTAPLVAQWAAAFNSSAVSLATAAPYTPMKVTLGAQVKGGVAVAALGDAVGNDIIWQPGTPMAVQPGRFLHIILKLSNVGAAGTGCVLRGIAGVDGFFE